MPATISHALSMTSPNDPAYENQPQHWNQAHAITLNISGTDLSNVFDNGGGVLFGTDGGGKITAQAPPGVPSPMNVSAGTTSSDIGSVVFSNSNGVSFGLNGSTITATVATNYQSQGAYLTTAMLSNAATLSNVRVSGGTTSNLLSAITFADGSGVSFGLNAGTMTASVKTDYQTSGAYLTTAMLSNAATISNIRLSAGTTSNLASAFTFADSNGISFGLNAGTITGTVATNYQSQGAYLTTAALSNHSHGNPQLNLTNLSGTTASNSAGFTLSLSAAAGGAGDGGNVLAAGTRTAGTNSTVLFSNANGVTFGLDAVNGSIITASVAAAGGAQTGISGIIASDATYTSGTVSFSNQANITIGSSVDGATQYIRLSGHAAQSVVPGIQTIAFANTTFTTGAVSFSNANGISFGSSGAQVTASHNALTSQSNQNVTAANGGFAFQTLSFSNLNGISFGTSAGSAITASHNAITTGRASTDAIGLNTAQTNVTWTVNSSGISLNAGGYLTTAMASNRGTDFVQATAAFSGFNASGTIASGGITVSVAAPGAAAENNAINLLGANTSGNTTASGSTIGWSGVNLTFSGTNNSQVVVSAPATSSLVGTNGISISTAGSTISIMANPITYSGHAPVWQGMRVVGNQGQGTFFIQPMFNAPDFQFDRVVMPIHYSNATNSSGSATLSFWVGLYTRNVSTLSMAHSSSFSHALSASGTVGSYSLFSGMRNLLMPWTTTVGANDYWLGIGSRTTSGGADKSFSQFLMSDAASTLAGEYGVAANATKQFYLGQGFYSATTAGVPGSIAFTQIQGTGSLNLRPPIAFFISGTI